MLQACEDDERLRRPKRKFLEQKLKPMAPLLKTLAKYATSPPGSTQIPDAGMKYRPPRWHQTLRAIFDDYETKTQAKIISLIESSFVDDGQASYATTSDDGFNTSSSNNVEDGDDSSG